MPAGPDTPVHRDLPPAVSARAQSTAPWKRDSQGYTTGSRPRGAIAVPLELPALICIQAIGIQVSSDPLASCLGILQLTEKVADLRASGLEPGIDLSDLPGHQGARYQLRRLEQFAGKPLTAESVDILHADSKVWERIVGIHRTALCATVSQSIERFGVEIHLSTHIDDIARAKAEGSFDSEQDCQDRRGVDDHRRPTRSRVRINLENPSLKGGFTRIIVSP